MRVLRCSAALIAGLMFLVTNAHNPIVLTMYTVDPAPLVYNDTLFVYTTHDEHTTSNFFTMHHWQLFFNYRYG